MAALFFLAKLANLSDLPSKALLVSTMLTIPHGAFKSTGTRLQYSGLIIIA
jgi:hypothetical protein